MILRVEELHTYYGLVHMLQGVSLEVGEGKVVGLLGRNGAGKTTVIKSIIGLVPPRRGKVVFKGEDITGLPPHVPASRGIAYVPASRGIFSALTAMENLQIVHRKSARWAPEDVFAMFPKLGELRSRRGRFLSGGEQQMLAIGRALLTGPSLILLDEPSQGLAPEATRSMTALIQRLAGRYTILLIEHKMDIVMSISQRITVMHFGQVIAEGAPDEIRRNDAVRKAYLGFRK